MAITAKVSAAEVVAQIDQRFINKYVEAVLINAVGVPYTPGTTNDATFLSFEVPQGQGGYERQVFTYANTDATAYSDDGVGMNTKGSIFAHDGSATTMSFTHAALVWGTGNVVSLDAAIADPATGVDGVYTDIPTSTNGSGTGLTVDLTIANNVFVFTPSRYGRNYAAGDEINVSEASMEAAGAISAGAGAATMLVGNVSANTEAGQIIAVAATSSQVLLNAGNEAAFYWDVKLYGTN